MGRGRGGRNRKPRNSATFRLCPRPGAADPSDRVLVRVDGNPYRVPGLDDDDDGCYFEGAFPSAAAGDDGAEPSSSASGAPLLDHVRRAILELGLPDDGYNYLAHIREIRPSYSSTGGGGSSAVFLPTRRTARCGLPLSVKAYDARGVGVGLDNVAGTGALMPVEEAVDPDITNLLEESEVPPETSENEDEESEVPPETSENEDEESEVPPGTVEDEDEESEVPPETSEDEDSELEDDFVIIANQPGEEDQMDLEDDFVILANQPDKEQMDMMDSRLERGSFMAALWAC